jgi:hypothetical protein
MRLSIWAAAMLMFAAEAPRAQGNELAAFQAALARDDDETAASALDRLIAARRPTTKALAVDPLLSALVGQLLVRRGEWQTGGTYLRRAAIKALPEDLRADTLLALAHSQEQRGDWRNGEATLQQAAAQRLTPDQSRRLVYAQARLALVHDPARAAALVPPAIAAAGHAQDRWEGELILGAARGLLGDFAGGRAAADRAWLSAAAAPARDAAPRIVALLHAANAADRDRRIAMLNVGGATDHKADSWIVNLLPICGVGGVTPRDFVTFAIFRTAGGRVAHLPLRASRTAVVSAFHVPLGGRDLFDPAASTSGGTLITVRCRSLVSPAYDIAPVAVSPLDDWFAERGLYPRMSRDFSFEAINAVASDLARLEERHGAADPRLLPTIGSLITMLNVRMQSDRNVEPARIAQLERRMRDIMRTMGAPLWLLGDEGDWALARAAASGEDAQRVLTAKRAMAEARMRQLPLDWAYSDMIEWFNNDAALPSKTKRAVLENMIERFAGAPDDLRRRALWLRLAGLQSADDERARALRSLQSAGAGPGTCPMMEETPKLLMESFSSDDYPADLIRYGYAGVVAFEVDVTREGRSAAPRLILSAPGDLFDPVTTSKLAGARFTPGSRAGRPVACQGYASRVLWRVPDDEEDEPAPEPATDPIPST